MKRSVTFVEVNIFDRMLPLVSGYLQAYVTRDPELDKSHRFQKYTKTVRESADKIGADILQHDSQVYALSCYLWNMGLMKQVTSKILAGRPHAYVLLGGPQVMHHAHEYLDAQHENLLICNGEGEITFSNFLREAQKPVPDFESVKGLSFFRDGTLITTETQPRVQSLDDIPSPYLNGIFEGNYRMAVMETNRGCPFRCSYCYWGAATNDAVYKFGEDRIRDEITWLSQNGTPMLYLADANWGMLKRDVAISSHLAECKKDRGVPFYVYFSAAKNSPERVSEIARVFDDVGMMNIQPVSLQTLDQTSLKTVDRQNIKVEAYELLQSELNEKGIGSFIELIWPLPGETLSSFKQGIEDLCVMEAAHIIAYPNLLLHNTPMYRQRKELGLKIRCVADETSEAELVVGTHQVDFQDFQRGLHFFYSVLALYNTHALKRLSTWLHAHDVMTYTELFDSFVAHARAHPSNVFTSFCDESIANDHYYDIVNFPTIYHITLHQNRAEFDRMLVDFVATQDWWKDERTAFLFEVDLLTKPYLYANTPIANYRAYLRFIEVSHITDRTVFATVPDRFLPLLKLPSDGIGRSEFRLDHARGQYPLMESQTREENASYCSGKIQLIGNILPDWAPVARI